jgi:hypothetical protein
MNLLKDLQKKYFKAVKEVEANTSLATGVAVVGIVVGAVGGGVGIDEGVVAASVFAAVAALAVWAFYGLMYYFTKKSVEERFQQRVSAIEGFLKENNLYTTEGIDWILESYKSKRGVVEVISGIVGKVLPVGMFFLGILFQKVSDEDIIKWIFWILVFLAVLIFVIVSFMFVSTDLSRSRKYLIEDLGYIKTQLAD